MEKQIMIMVLSYDAPPYDALMRAQQETWDAVYHPQVKTVYYTGGCPPGYAMDFKIKQVHPWAFQYAYKASDDYNEMHWKFKLCLDQWLKWPLPFTIFRTNSSSYVDKEELVKFAAALPDEKCYAGWQLGQSCISGAGMFLSRDVAQILAEELKEGKRIEEDVLIGRTLARWGVGMTDDKTRFDVKQMVQTPPLDRYHYRFKTADRAEDAVNMRLFHELKMSKRTT